MTPYYSDDSVTLYHGDCREMAYRQGKRVNGATPAWTSRWTDVGIAGDESTELRDEALRMWGASAALVFGTWKRRAPTGTREVLVWDKVVSTGMGALDVPWRPSWEAIYVLGPGFVGPRGHGVLRCALPTLAPDRKWHPTPKPVSLLMALLAKCPSGTVADPFAGAGSTLPRSRKAIADE